MTDYNNIKLSKAKIDSEFIYDGHKFYGSNFNTVWFSELGIIPKVILDVGSYDFGDSIRYKIEFQNSKVFGFEADKNRYEKTYKFAENCGIKTFNKAVYSKSGVIDFYPAKCFLKDAGSFHKPGEYGGQGSIYKHNEKYKTNFPHIEQEIDPVKVESTSISDFCLSENLNEISLIHIDAEGAESDVINGFGDIRPKLIYMEVQNNLFNNGISSQSVHDLIIKMNYTLVKDLGIDKLYIYNN